MKPTGSVRKAFKSKDTLPLFSLDGLVNLPIFRPWALLFSLIYARLADPSVQLSSTESALRDILLRVYQAIPGGTANSNVSLPPLPATVQTVVTGLLGVYAVSWASRRWRNGLLKTPIRLSSIPGAWEKELAFVTGGANGIGKATVELLAEKGCRVAAVDVVDFQSSHPNVKTYKCDIASIDELRNVQKQIKADFGGQTNKSKGKGSASTAEAAAADGGHDGEVTMVLNIAGINNKSLILDLDEKKVERMLNVNLKSHFLTAIVFLPNMVKRKRGHFLSVGSTMSYVGITHQSDYVATKSALPGMFESLRYELDKMYKTPEVRTSLAIIGHTRTALFSDWNVAHPLARWLGPLITPESVALRIVEDALDRQESTFVCHPFANHTAPLFRALPSFMRDAMQWAAGGDGAYPSRPSKAQLGE